jgi:hypothetical protein
MNKLIQSAVVGYLKAHWKQLLTAIVVGYVTSTYGGAAGGKVAQIFQIIFGS